MNKVTAQPKQSLMADESHLVLPTLPGRLSPASFSKMAMVEARVSKVIIKTFANTGISVLGDKRNSGEACWSRTQNSEYMR